MHSLPDPQDSSKTLFIWKDVLHLTSPNVLSDCYQVSLHLVEILFMYSVVTSWGCHKWYHWGKTSNVHLKTWELSGISFWRTHTSWTSPFSWEDFNKLIVRKQGNSPKLKKQKAYIKWWDSLYLTPPYNRIDKPKVFSRSRSQKLTTLFSLKSQCPTTTPTPVKVSKKQDTAIDPKQKLSVYIRRLWNMFWNMLRPKIHSLGVKKVGKPFNPKPS